MKIHDRKTAREIWEALQHGFQSKSCMVAVDLRHRLQQERCPEKGDLRTHFAKLRTMQEDLAAMDHPPGEDELYAIILGSLPSSYEPFVAAMNATSSVLGTFMSTDDLMQALTDEYDRRNLGRSSKKEENAAFSAATGERGSKKQKRPGKCNNCGKPGHWARDCWEEGGGKEGQKSNRKGMLEWQMRPEFPEAYTCMRLCVHSFYTHISFSTVPSVVLPRSLSMAFLALLPLMILVILCHSYHLDILLSLPF
jgi:hypothetical protein